MGALSAKLRSVEGGMVAFWCPGCDGSHALGVGTGDGPRWGYNGNPDAPTFTPSVHVKTGHYVGNGQPGGCWCDYEERLGRPKPDGTLCACTVCHSFVTDGCIQFLGDCTHELAGQTVDLPDWPQGERQCAA
jgi:hypothetical protein